ncbi:MAG: restriction endonuclease subunit S [Candidatus Omnitrophica bacterium]|nr:restriction endonuclease subunit S [Candidatus Omnitrophota bacterium]
MVTASTIEKGYKQTELGVIPEDWDVKKLGEIGFFSKGQGIRKDQSQSGELPCIRYGELYTRHSNYIKQYYSFISKEIAATAKKLAVGDILFAGSGETKEEIGKCAAFIDNIEAYAGGDVVIFSPYSTDSLILGYLLNAPIAVKQKASKGQGDAVVHISASNLKEVKIPLPSLVKEQTAIATVLFDTDALIERLDKLIFKKKTIKQGAMQQLLTGKKRLPGFSGKWEVKRLGEIGNCIRGVSYNGKRDLSSYDTDTTVRLLRSNNVQDGSIDLSELQFVNYSRVKPIQELQENDIVICMANGSKQLVGKSGIFNILGNYKYTFGAFMGCFRTSSIHAVSRFISFTFQTHQYRSYIDVLLSGSSINNLKPSDIESIEIPYPTKEEQAAISTVLSDVDAEIKRLEQEKDKYIMIKQGIMQELLTGKMRLI